MVTEKGSASWPGIAGFECFKFCLVWGVEQLYIHVPLYRCTSMYIGRGQVLFQNSYVFCQVEKQNFLGFSLLGRSRPCNPLFHTPGLSRL